MKHPPPDRLEKAHKRERRDAARAYQATADTSQAWRASHKDDVQVFGVAHRNDEGVLLLDAVEEARLHYEAVKLGPVLSLNPRVIAAVRRRQVRALQEGQDASVSQAIAWVVAEGRGSPPEQVERAIHISVIQQDRRDACDARANDLSLPPPAVGLTTTRTSARPRSGRPSRRSTRSSAASGDSGDSGPGEPEPAGHLRRLLALLRKAVTR